MIFVDRLIIGGVRWVLEKVADAVEAQLEDDSSLRDELLQAQMELEVGRLSEEEYALREADVLRRMREARERREGRPAEERALGSGEFKVLGVEAEVDVHPDQAAAPGPEAAPGPAAVPDRAPSKPGKASRGKGRSRRR